jgi:hypothetical protein
MLLALAAFDEQDKMQREFVNARLVGSERTQDLVAVVSLLLQGKLRQPSNEASGRVQGSRVNSRGNPAATPVHGAEQ